MLFVHTKTIARLQILLMVMLFLPAQIARANSSVSACGETLSTPGETYELTQNISIDSADCLTVTADNVTIDGMGLYSITVTTSGTAINASGTAAPGHSVTIQNLTINASGLSAINTNGDGGANNGGAITVTDSTITGSITANGGQINTSGYAGNGGTVSINNSTTDDISSNGGIGTFDGSARGGNAGSITVINGSAVGNISAEGGDANLSGGTGGAVSVQNSTSDNITTIGGAVTQSIATAGDGGTVSISASTVGNINSSGGETGGTPGFPADAAVVTVTGASVTGDITSDGGDGNGSSALGGDGAQMIIADAATVGALSCVGGIGNPNGTSCTNPAIVSLSPADDGTDIATDTDLSITLDEIVYIVNGATISIYKTLGDVLAEQITTPSASVTGNGTTTISIDRSVQLEDGHEYYVQISAGAFKDTMRSTFGGIADETTWSFTTVVDSIAPTLSSFTASAGSNTIVLTYSEDLDETSVPAAGDFAVTSDGSPLTVNSVAVNGTDITLTMSANIAAAADILLDYTPGVDPVRDDATTPNNAAALTEQPVLPGDAPDLIATDSGRSSTDNITTDTTPLTTSTCMGLDDTHTVQWYLNGVASGVPVTCSSDNTTFAAGVSGLAAGSYAVRHAVSKDGVFSARGPTLTLVIDTSAPSAPGAAPDLAAGSDSGVNTDNITNDQTPTFTGDCDADDDVQLFINGVSTGSADTCTDANDTYSVTAGSISTDGSYNFTVKFTDAAGNTSTASAALSVTIDTVTDTPVITSPADGTSTNDNTPTFSGTTEANATVTVKEGSNTLCTDNTTSGGTWSCTSSTLLDSDYSVIASAVDPASNAAALSSAVDITVDTALPSAPGTPDLIAGSDTGTNSDNITADSTPSITVTCEIGSTIKLFEDSDTVTPVYSDECDDGTEEITLSLTDNAYIYYASQTDDADNDSADSATLALTIDSSASAPTIGSPSDGSTIVFADTLTVSGSCETNGTVYVANANITGTPVSGSCTGGAYSIDVTWVALTTGTNVLSVTQIDVAGNASPARTVSVGDGVASSSSSSSDAPVTGPTGGGRGNGTALQEALQKAIERDPKFSSHLGSSARKLFQGSAPLTTCVLPGHVPDARVYVGAEFFSDVAADAWYRDNILSLSRRGIVTGFRASDGELEGLFRADNPTLVAEALQMALLARGEEFANTPGLGWFRPTMERGGDLGLNLSRHMPLSSITRAETAELFVEVFGMHADGAVSPFADVPVDHRSARAIALLSSLNVLRGDRDEKIMYRPEEPISRAEFTVALDRLIQRVRSLPIVERPECR